ncbi:MAG: hypothetical protein H7Z19_20690 [Chitinophagaceae bacterium]|nr:hypothetical protein [Rubrivivax sp.]
MNLTHTVPIAALVIAALSACAQMPAGTSTSQSPAVASAHAMPASPAGDRMAMMDSQMKSMREMHERMVRARSPDERLAMRAEHMKMMQDGMAMMGGMGPAGGMSGMKGMHGMGTTPADMPQRQQMMEKHMEMMQSMMQMMMDQMPPAQARP